MTSSARNSQLPIAAATILCALLAWHSLSNGSAATSAARADEKAGVDADRWHLLPIPESWKKPPSGKLAGRDGLAWYRCVVDVPASWKGRKLELFVEPVDDARAVYVNGGIVGAAGTFPPQYRSGLGEAGRYRVPAEAIRFGKPNVIAVRVYFKDGRTNFSVAAPVLLAGSEAIRMEGQWQYRPGDDPAWAKMPAQLPPDSKVRYDAVDEVDDVDRYVRRRKGDHDPFAPADALETFRVAEGLRLDQPVADPEVRQPLFMNFDERGRLWVLQYLQYPDPAGLKAISRDKYLRTVYDKVPPPPPNHFRGADKITIHEDTDADGVYDKHKTFVDGLNIATSFARGRGGVWVMNPPYLLFYPDENNDDVPDGDPVVHLEGFGMEDTHSVANSLRWGPDGWLYGAQGSTVTGDIRKPGSDQPGVHSLGQLIWRYHPESKRYEVFAEGGGNTFGVEVDAKGRIYSGHNGGDTRGFHYVQGGYYRKGFGKHGELSNPYAFGYFPHMPHHSVPRFTHNYIIYDADALPDAYRGMLFGVEPLQGQVVQSEVTPNGTSFATKDVGRPVTTEDQWFRPVDIKVGPDGGIYIADLYEQRIDHSSHFSGRTDRASGRIYRIANGSETPDQRSARFAAFDHGKRTSAELVTVLGHPNKWHRQTALRLLADRRDASVIPALLDVLEKEVGQHALEALWALNLSGGLTEETASELLDHSDPHVRLWTVRLLCDGKQAPPAIATRLAELAARESSAEVRSQLACSARRLPAKDSLPIVNNLLRHDEDAGDVHLPLLLWWAVEANAGRDPEAVLALFRDTGLWKEPLVEQNISERLMKRFAMAGTQRDLLSCARLLESAPDRKEVGRLMKGFENAFEGRTLSVLPEELVTAIAKSGGGSLALKVRQGDGVAVREALKVIADETVDAKRRLRFIHVFGQAPTPAGVAALLGIVGSSASDEIRSAALTSLQPYDDARIADAVIDAYGALPDEVRTVAQTLLASRPRWVHAFLKAVDDGRIESETVTAPILRKFLLHDDAVIAGAVKKHWGEMGGRTTAQMRAEIDRLVAVVGESSGNPYPGKILFMQNCGKCHTLFKQGGQIGPDLTAYKRDDLQRMLLNVVNPSAEIREGFENFVVLTTGGRIVNGFLADQDNRIVVLRGVDGQNLVIARDDIEEMRAVPRSVMPDGALDKMADQQIRDLFAYLRGKQPLP